MKATVLGLFAASLLLAAGHTTAQEVVYAAPAQVPAIECCPISVLHEIYTPAAKHKLRCDGATHQVLCVDNPADGCRKYYSVKVCVPACCVGEPVCTDTKVGLLGRGYTCFRWPCGYEVTVVFRVYGGVLLWHS